MTNHHNLIKALQHLTFIYDKATINQLVVLTYVASQEGKSSVLLSKDMPDALMLTQTTVSRALGVLGDGGYTKDKGLKLVTLSVDPSDERQRVVALTPRGRQLAAQILGDLYG